MFQEQEKLNCSIVFIGEQEDENNGQIITKINEILDMNANENYFEIIKLI